MRLILIERYGSSDGDVITLLNFLSAGLLLVNYWYNSWPTAYRQSADRLLGELFFTFTEVTGNMGPETGNSPLRKH